MSQVNRTLFYFLWFYLLNIISGQKCGRVLQSAKIEGKIVGGYEVGYYKYPWFASLDLDGEAWCGGSLIAPGIVVTAAHCFKDAIKQNAELEKLFDVKLGVYNHCKREQSQKTFKVKKVIVHEEYMKNQPYYDISLMILQGDTKGFEPVCLPPKPLGDQTRGREAYIIGFGTIKYGSSKYPCKMHEGRVLLYKDKTCKNMILNATDDKEDYAIKDAFCAGYMQGGVDACQGDSGGPIMIMAPNGQFQLLGLTSFGYDCAQKNLLGIYTDVSHYLGWIKDKAGVSPQKPVEPPKPPINPTESPNPSSNPNPGPNPNPKPTQIPGHTDYPIFPWTDPPTLKPPMVYTTMKPGHQISGAWPPKRIIIEFKKKRKHHHHNHHHKKGQNGKRRPHKIKNN